MKTPPPHICSSTCHKKCVEKEEPGVDCSTASSCDSSPSFLEIYSKKRKGHPSFDKELIQKPFHRYEMCTDTWGSKTATGQYAPGGSSGSPVDVDDKSNTMQSGQPTGSKSSGKRSAPAPDWRDDDPTGVVKQKFDIAESVKRSLDTWGQLNAARLKTWEEDHLHVDLSKLNDDVFTFVEEVGIRTCVNAIDILLARKEMAYSWLLWSRPAKLYWLQQYAV